MEIAVALTSEVIVLPDSAPGAGTGALLEFQGMVRDLENGKPISALCYEVYEPMACRALREILERLGDIHPCQAVTVIHRYGVIPVGEVAIFVRVESAHRAAGIRLLEDFMNELKLVVPIWKIRTLPC